MTLLQKLPMRAGTIPMNSDGSADGVDVSHFMAGEVYAKQVQLRAGRILVGHKHNYDHLSILASGAVAVTVCGKSTVYVGPTAVLIEANKVHEVAALKDSLWYCVHSVPEDTPLMHIDDSLIAK